MNERGQKDSGSNLQNVYSPMSEEMKNIILNAQDHVAVKTPIKMLGTQEHQQALKAGTKLWTACMKMLQGKDNTTFISEKGEIWTIYTSRLNKYTTAPDGTELTISHHTSYQETTEQETINYITELDYFISQKGVIMETINRAENLDLDEPRPPKQKHISKEELGRKEIQELIKKLKRAESFGPLHEQNVHLELAEIDEGISNLRKEIKKPFIKRLIGSFRRRFSY